MKFKNVYFLKSCKKESTFPKYTHPEFAFFGRSNVGKSSLINMLLGQKNLVKTGSKPGVTQLINFFVIDDRVSIVDLPGYGFAKVPKEIKNSFTPMIRGYVENRPNLKLAFLLIDIRRVPDKFEHDLNSFLIENDIPVAVTLTKCDKLSGNQRAKNLKKILAELEIDRDSVFFTSTKTGEGKKDLLKLLDDFRE